VQRKFLTANFLKGFLSLFISRTNPFEALLRQLAEGHIPVTMNGLPFPASMIKLPPFRELFLFVPLGVGLEERRGGYILLNLARCVILRSFRDVPAFKVHMPEMYHNMDSYVVIRSHHR